jgi:predicted AAA+ superfamily ATPase
MIIRQRYIDEIHQLAEYFPVIGILGARQVGKTTLAKEMMTMLKKKVIYLDLEKPSDLAKLTEPEMYFNLNKEYCIIIDEVQLKPELFAVIRSSVDEFRVPLRFIILGSANPEIIRQTSQSLAGRVSYVFIHPFSLSELNNKDRIKHHFRGGFPESYLAPNDKVSKRWLDDFIITFIERDLPLLGLSASPDLTRRLWEMLAWQNGNLLNSSMLGNSLGLTHHTIRKYIDFIEGAFMLKTIMPFHANINKRLVKSPKVYFTDTGILHRILRIENYDQLIGMPVLGGSFEAYVLHQLLVHKSSETDIYFYRTHAGTEIDFVLTRSAKPVCSIEVKFTSSLRLTKGLRQGIEDLQTKNNYIIIPESEIYPIAENIHVAGIYPFIIQILPGL